MAVENMEQGGGGGVGGGGGAHAVVVTAPSNLTEGYVLQMTDEDGNTVTVVVPPGGVKAGQTFTGQLVHSETMTTTTTTGRGQWKDELCDCCVFGCCHPVICLGCWLPSLAMAQVMTRFNLNWIGRPNSDPVNKTFRTTVYILVGYIVVSVFLAGVTSATRSAFLEFVENVVQILFFVYIVVGTALTRRQVREYYDIPESDCEGCEDGCCAFWCTCCTITQMLRHSADYDQYPAACCTENGLSANAPQRVA